MAVFEALTPAERAGQLRNPEGAVGLAVAEWLNETNRAGNARIVALLGVGPGSHVLEIGFGNGRTVPDVIAQAAEVHSGESGEETYRAISSARKSSSHPAALRLSRKEAFPGAFRIRF